LEEIKCSSREKMLVIVVLLTVITASAFPAIDYFIKAHRYEALRRALQQKLNAICASLSRDLAPESHLRTEDDGHTLIIEKGSENTVIYKHIRFSGQGPSGTLSRAVAQGPGENRIVSDKVSEFRVIREGDRVKVLIQLRDCPGGEGSPALILSRTLTIRQ